MYEEITKQLSDCLTYLKNAASLRPGAVVVMGCSTSEVAGGHIGHNSVPELGDALAQTMIETCRALNLQPVFQCCEHLNRALVMERAEAEKRNLDIVCAVPRKKAGGSLATAAWKMMEAPVLVEKICADAGIDIGLTLIGMHLKAVAVPVRLKTQKVGCALVTAARTRPKLIGGERACYTEE